MRCLITGATGFVGSHVAEHAIRRGWDTICPARSTVSLKYLKGMPVRTCSYEDLPGELRRSPDIDFVIHVAGATRALTYTEYHIANVEFTRWFIDLLISSKAANNIRRFALVSSQAAAGPCLNGFDPISEDDAPRPISSYGRSKLAGEKLAQEYSDRIPLTIVRPPTVFGPRDTDVFGVFKSARYRIIPVVAGPDRLVSIIHVRDLADGIVTAVGATDIPTGEIFFLANERPVIWREFARQIALSMGYRAVVAPVPLAMMRLLGKAGDAVSILTKKPALLRSEKIMEMEQLAWVCSASKARGKLRWVSATPLKTAIDITRDWYISEGWL